MNKILCIGEALIDMVCTDKDMPLSKAEHFLKKPGGAPANVAAAIGALGGNVTMLAKVGNDPFGEQLIEVLQQFDVCTEFVFKDKALFTTMAFVSLLQNGERDFVFNRGADGYLNTNEIDAVKMNDYSIIHFGSATAFLSGDLQQAYFYLFNKAQAQNIFTSFDPNYRHLLFHDKKDSFIKQSWQFLDKVNFFKLSDEEALLLTGATTIEDSVVILSKKTKAVFTITLGAKGSLLRVQDFITTIPAVPANVVDTTGAGDSFTGAVLFQLQKKSPAEIKTISAGDWIDIISKANSIAARTCEHYGAMEAFLFLKNDKQ